MKPNKKDLLSNVFHRFVVRVLGWLVAQERNIQDGEIWLHNGRERTSRYIIIIPPPARANLGCISNSALFYPTIFIFLQWNQKYQKKKVPIQFFVTLFQTSWCEWSSSTTRGETQNGQKGVVNLVPTISRVNNMFTIRDCAVFHSPLENFQARNKKTRVFRVDDGLPSCRPCYRERERLAFVNHLFF